MVDDIAEPEELTEAHDERSPFARVNAVRIAVHTDSGIDMNAYDADLDGDEIAAAELIGGGEGVSAVEHGLEVNRAFRDAGRAHSVGIERGKSGERELVVRVPVAHGDFVRRHGVGAGGASESIDGSDLVHGGEVEHTLAGTQDIGGCL